MAENQQQEIEVLQRKVSELQGELKTELKHSKSTDAETHVSSITRCLWYLMWNMYPLLRHLLLFFTGEILNYLKVAMATQSNLPTRPHFYILP